jgi:hypothetical protein
MHILWDPREGVLSPLHWPLPDTQQTQETKIHVLSGIRNRFDSNRAAADLRLKQRGRRYQSSLLTDTHTLKLDGNR